MKVPAPALSVSRMVPASATVEEMDEWIIAQGGQPIPPEELKDFVAHAQWADVKAENPGDADFPFASALK
ncbi:MAG: hypothetical protein ACKOEG_10170 [Chthoniobacterales bacterium]